MQKPPALLATLAVATLLGCDRPNAAPPPTPGSTTRAPTPRPFTPTSNQDIAGSVPPEAQPAPAADAPTALHAILRTVGPRPPLRPLLKRSWGTLWGFQTTRTGAIADRNRLRDAALTSGYYPIVFCDEHGLGEDLDNRASPAEILEHAKTCDAAQILRDKLAELLDEKPPDFSTDDPNTNDADAFVVPTIIDTNKTPLNIAFVPTTDPWAIMAYLQMGDWNDNPANDVHVAVMKYWYDRYGAEPVTVTSDIIEMSVARPPTDTQACRALALEQFAYTAGDLVYQGYQHLGTLARVLSGRKHWFFWWD